MIVHRLSFDQSFCGWPSLEPFASYLMTSVHFSSSSRDTSGPEHLANKLRLFCTKKDLPPILETQGLPLLQQETSGSP